MRRRRPHGCPHLAWANLVVQPDPSELFVALRNTTAADARAVESRSKVLSDAVNGLASYEQGYAVSDLLEHAWGDAGAKRR